MTLAPFDQGQRDACENEGFDASTRTFLRLAIAAIVGCSLAFIAVILIFTPDQMRRIANPVAGISIALLAWLLLRGGKTKAAITVLAYGAWAVVTGIAIATGGIRTPVVFSLPLIIFFSGWLLGSRAAIGLAALSVTVFLGIAVAEYLDLLPQTPPTPPFMHWIVQVTIYILAAATIVYLRNSHHRQVEEVRALTAELARQRAESAAAATLRRHQELLDRTGRLARVGGWELDVRSGKRTWTAETFHIHDLEPAAAPPPLDEALAYCPPEARNALENALAQAIDNGVGYDLELPVRTAKGRQIWVRTQGRPQFENGRVVRVTGAIQDITEQRAAAQALRESLNNLQCTLEATDEGIFGYDGTDPSGKLLFANDRLFELWKIPREDAPTTGRPGIIAAARKLFIDPDAEVKRIDEILAMGVVHEDKIRLNDGRIFFRRSIPLLDGSQVSRVWSFRDITAEEQVKAELQASRDEAQRANAAKSEFLSRMSHELRTPMHAIMGMMALARRRMGDPQGLDQLDKAGTAAAHLLALINDILDISKIEAGRLTLEQAEFRLADVLDHLLDLVGQRAAEKGLTLHIEQDADIAALRLCGDSLRLGQILLNLAGNAIKFTDRGEIVIRIKLIEDMPSHVRLRFEVVDGGIGISAEEQQRLFVAFEQADGSMTRKYGGSGLGLAISKQLAAMMDGEIGVDSVVGRGSTFWFSARLGKTADSIAEAAPPSDLPGAEEVLRSRYGGASILLVDDDPVGQEVSRWLLLDVGFAVDLAEDGTVAVRLARQNRYDAILMDMQMPTLNGVEATRQIRADSLNRATPIIAMTANAFAEDRQLCLDAGMNDHVGKPVEPERLFNALLKWLDR